MDFWRGLVLGMVALMVISGGGQAQLSQNFYQETCPNVEWTVRQTVMTKMKQTFTTAPATLRLFFHDCFIEGCDASILISSPNGDVEKDAEDNLSLAGDGFDTVIQAKQAVEAACPGVVSCADILALAARDVVTLTGGPRFNVELGRRDGRISSKSRVPGNLPLPSFDLNLLISIFMKNNLTMSDMIVLSGAHTIGFSHCDRFADRLYSPSGVDPLLNPIYADQLMKACPRNVDPRIAISMDPISPNAFDNAYFRNLVNGKGLFSSDQVLFSNPISRQVVYAFANNPQMFTQAFADAMVRLGRSGVKTGDQGGIRRDCSVFS